MSFKMFAAKVFGISKSDVAPRQERAPFTPTDRYYKRERTETEWAKRDIKANMARVQEIFKADDRAQDLCALILKAYDDAMELHMTYESRSGNTCEWLVAVCSPIWVSHLSGELAFRAVVKAKDTHTGQWLPHYDPITRLVKPLDFNISGVMKLDFTGARVDFKLMFGQDGFDSKTQTLEWPGDSLVCGSGGMPRIVPLSEATNPHCVYGAPKAEILY